MLKAKKQDKCALAYGILITIFLKNFCVPITDEMTLVETPHFCINATTLSIMGFVEYGGQWYPSG